MSDLICRKTMTQCLTPGMCSPFGGCATAEHEASVKLVAENQRLFQLLERLVEQMLPVEEMKNLPGYSCVPTAEALLAERDQLKAENEALRVALSDAADEVESWGAYASDYFQKKHDLAGAVSKFRDAAMSKEAGQ